MRFQPGANEFNKDLFQLKESVGGVTGTLVYGKEKLGPVLRVEENVYISASKVSKHWDVIASQQQSDIHEVKTQADVANLARRIRGLKWQNARDRAKT